MPEKPTILNDLLLLDLTQEELKDFLAAVPAEKDITKGYQDLVKRSYKAAALVWHPDRSDDPGAVDKMKALNAANDRLMQVRVQSRQHRPPFHAVNLAGFSSFDGAQVFHGFQSTSASVNPMSGSATWSQVWAQAWSVVDDIP